MPICPKCETEYRDGFDSCFDCHVQLVDSIKRPESLASVEEKYAEDMFDEPEDSIRFCLNCFVEFAPEASICPPCGDRRLETAPRRVFDGLLARSPLEPYRVIDEDEMPSGRSCVFVAHSPADAGFAIANLEGMGVEATIGHDLIDQVKEDSHIGVWVADEDVEACGMILPEDPNEWRDDEEMPSEDPYMALVKSANTYLEIGKRKHATRLCTDAMEISPDRSDAFFSLGHVVGQQGLVKQAHESFRAALERHDAGTRSPAAWFFVIYGFLQDDLTPSFKGPKADEALAILWKYSEGNPRSMEAMRLLLEACFARGEKANVGEIRQRMDRLNRFVLEAEGPHETMKFA